MERRTNIEINWIQSYKYGLGFVREYCDDIWHTDCRCIFKEVLNAIVNTFEQHFIKTWYIN